MYDGLYIYTASMYGMLWLDADSGSVLQKREINRATGKLIGQVEPTRNALNRRIRLRSLDRNQVINAQIEAMIA